MPKQYQQIDSLEQSDEILNFVRVIKLEGNFLFDKATRNDFLTSITNGASIKEDQVKQISTVASFLAQSSH